MDSNEAFYDFDLAPRLLEIARLCQARGMSFVAMVEYAQGDSGETCWVAPDASIKPIVAQWGVKCRGNIDSFMIAAERHAREHGHSSAVLTLRGIPTSPPSRESTPPKESA